MRLRNTLLIGLWALSCGTGARADALVEELDLKAAYVFKAMLIKVHRCRFSNVIRR